MRERPVLTDEEEAEIVRRQKAAKMLGIKGSYRLVRCVRCLNDYQAGSGHRGSLWCDQMQRMRLLRERGMTSISFNYLGRIKEAGATYEIHDTMARSYHVPKGEKAPYKGVSELVAQLWVPVDVSKVFGKQQGEGFDRTLMPLKKRMQLLRELVAQKREEWLAAGIGLSGRQDPNAA